jgi:hypothetical protein
VRQEAIEHTLQRKLLGVVTKSDGNGGASQLSGTMTKSLLKDWLKIFLKDNHVEMTWRRSLTRIGRLKKEASNECFMSVGFLWGVVLCAVEREVAV